MSNLNSWKVIVLVVASVFSLSTLAGEGVRPICKSGQILDKAKTTCVDKARPKSGSTSFKPNHNEPKPGLLLPAVQKAQGAPGTQRPSGIKPIAPKFGTVEPSQSTIADTTCSGVNSCNDMIATCIALGGNVSPTGYDGETGAPNSATCYSPGN